MASPYKERTTAKSKALSRPISGDPPDEKPMRKSGERRKSNSPKKTQSPVKRSSKTIERSKDGYASSQTSTNILSVDSLAKLNAHNEKVQTSERERAVEREKKEKVVTGRVLKERGKHRRRDDEDDEKRERRKKRRIVSGAILEEGRGRRGGYLASLSSEDNGKRKRICWIVIGFIVLLLIILIPVGVLVVGKQNGASDPAPAGSAATGTPNNSNLNGTSENDIPEAAKGSYLDPFTWYDTQDFNVTYTNETVGGLPIMGLNSIWNDSTQANQYVPPLNQKFNYGQMPIRGVNIGGWLSLEPFITPSLFSSYDSDLGIVDEYTLSQHLGAAGAAQTIEKHYSNFVNEQTFADIQAAGFDHVRIPYSYWAVTTYPGDPYVPKISWRYLLRGIEYARKYGLRVNLDLHAVPGSQNGWNHSGRQGAIGWINGTDGSLNLQRSIDIHNQLSTFFAQPRYDNVIGIYGLLNEPRMTLLPVQAVLDWTTTVVSTARQNGIKQTIAFGDGFLGLPNWKGKLQGIEGLVMDAHQYVIFNVQQIAFTHQTKINFACSGWSAQMTQSINVATGFGPTLCGEWSQADTDCTQYLNNVGVGSRWAGNMNLGSAPSAGSILTPSCPPNSGTCECADANADPSDYSDTYKQWLMMNAEAQMTSFEIGWGWFYWTWQTESAVQWSWKLGMQAGILPAKVWDRAFNCTQTVPNFSGLPENY
ncbi:hypothetical protein MMC17_000560 [Xylographa soralifera]|nr:hypothetical protein [Xylographa soralifera]